MSRAETTRDKQVLGCDDCGKRYDVSRFSPGKRFRCKDCRAILTVPTPAEDLRGRYDPRKKILFCPECARPLDVRKLQPGEKLSCPRCKTEAAAPAEHEPAVPRTVKQTSRALYDPESKTLTCGGCQAEYVVARYEPGREILCLGCETILVVPSDHLPSRQRDRKKRKRYKTKASTALEPEQRKRKKRKEPQQEKKRRKKKRKRVLLCCAHCEYKFDVTGVDSGRTVMCPKCEQLTEVPRLPVPDALNQSAGELAVIDLDADKPGREGPGGAVDIQSARDAFSAFYEGQQELDEDDDEPEPAGERRTTRTTRATRLVPTIEIDEILEPRVKGRRGLADAATRAAGLVPRRSAAAKKPFPIFLAGGLALLVPCLVLAAYLYVQARRDIASKKYAAARPSVVEAPAPQDASPIQPGAKVEIRGVVRGGTGSLLAGKRCGFLLVTRGSGDLWVEDPSKMARRTFEELLELHRQNRPITVKLIGTVKQIGELEGTEGLPAVLKSHRYWIELEGGTIERIGYADFTALSSSVKALKK